MDFTAAGHWASHLTKGASVSSSTDVGHCNDGDSLYSTKMTASRLQGLYLTLRLCPSSTWHRLDTE